MPVVPDASPLIALSKVSRVDLLTALYREALVTPGVWEEAVVQGRMLGAADAGYLEMASRELPLIRVTMSRREKELSDRLRQEWSLGKGESEALAVAGMRRAMVVIDDKAGRAAAVALGIARLGTIGVVHQAYVRRMIAYQDLVGLLETLGKTLWLSPDLLAGVLKQAWEAERK